MHFGMYIKSRLMLKKKNPPRSLQTYSSSPLFEKRKHSVVQWMRKMYFLQNKGIEW